MANITIAGADGSFDAYIAKPKSGSGPGLLLIQEVFGINGFMRAAADRLAGEGFVVVAPDLFWRIKPGIQLDPDVEAEFKQALNLLGTFDQDKGVEDLRATLAHMRALPEITGKVGCSGYCLGGRLTYMMAARSDIDASVGYYGVGLEQLLGEKDKIKKPLMLHIAEEDGFVPKAAQAQIHAGLDDQPRITLHDYAGVDHGFARAGAHAYNAPAAKLADQRSAEFLHKNLA